MIEAITQLRKIAEQTEMHSRKADLDSMSRAELADIAVKWHWLAGEAAKLCSKVTQLSEAAVGVAEGSKIGLDRRSAAPEGEFVLLGSIRQPGPTADMTEA